MTSSVSRRRATLDRQTILDAAMRLAAEGGPDAVSVRKLGLALGADPTAIYRHFRDMDELGDALLDMVYGRVVEHLDEELSWRARLEQLAHEMLALLLAHPAVAVRASVTMTTGSHETDGIEYVLAALTDAGLEGEDLLEFYAFLVNYLLSFSASVAWLSVGRGRNVDPRQQPWVPRVFPVDAGRHPLIATHAAALTSMTQEKVFEAGLALILDGVEMRSGHKSR